MRANEFIAEGVSAKDILKYVKSIHHDFHIDDTILAHPQWELKRVPLNKLHVPDPESGEDLDDPYNRVQMIDMYHVDDITQRDIESKPIVVDTDGHIIDGNHRALAARLGGMKDIPAYIPVKAGVTEAFDQPYKSKWETSEYGDVDANTKLPDGTYLNIMFNQEYDGEGNEVIQVEFHRNNSQEVTGEGDAQRIFATVLATIQKYIKKYKPQNLIFSASKEVDPGQNSESRAKLYNRLVQRYASSWGYQSQHSDDGDAVRYQLTRTVSENFADGKVKGKSRPGRVKRAGASCNGSVTDLRHRAKNASGEKAKMYHWCANMKSGKKK
jgi:hypothetical protein